MNTIFSSGFAIAIIILLLLLARCLKIAAENQRFAILRLGKYAGLKGPGLLLKFSGSETLWERLTVGDRGELVAPGIGQFKRVQVPVEIDRGVLAGSTIRLIGFTGDSVLTMLDPNQQRKVVCEKCGHEMTV